jgi:DNA-binding PadR family transcriptional regulator
MIKRLDVIVLGLLTARPRTGYDVRKWLETYGRVIGYSAPPSQIYRQLTRLEDRGWAESVIDPRSSGPDAKPSTNGPPDRTNRRHGRWTPISRCV